MALSFVTQTLGSRVRVALAELMHAYVPPVFVVSCAGRRVTADRSLLQAVLPNNYKNARFDVLTAMLLKIYVFWDAAPCWLLRVIHVLEERSDICKDTVWQGITSHKLNVFLSLLYVSLKGIHADLKYMFLTSGFLFRSCCQLWKMFSRLLAHKTSDVLPSPL